MSKSIEAVYKEVGKRIATIRKSRNLSQDQLALGSGLDRSHVGYIEQGHRKPTISTLIKITKTLGISLEKLFKGL